MKHVLAALNARAAWNCDEICLGYVEGPSVILVR